MAKVEVAGALWRESNTQTNQHKQAANKAKKKLKLLHEKQAPLHDLQE
jgi:hypothetical protein